MKALSVLSLLLVCGSALADDGALLHCRALTAPGARLACYDAIPAGAQRATPAVTSAATSVVAPAAPVALTTPAAAAPTPDQRFGMETVRRAEPDTPKFIESTIPGNFEGWGPGTQFKLANGQVWRVADGSAADLPPMRDVRVRIVRNMFGTLFLEIPGTNNSPKVRRVN